MKLKKLAALALTVLVAISALSITAFAADPIGTNPTTLKDGKKTSASIPYKSYVDDYDNGHNYKDFKYVAASEGTLTIKFDISVDESFMRVYNSDKQKLTPESTESKTGSVGARANKDAYVWDGEAGLYSGVIKYKVTKGTYYIRVQRNIDSWGGNTYFFGREGNGRLHLTCTLETAPAPTNIKVSNITGSSAKFTWTEPKGCSKYDLRYRVQGTDSWTIKKNINDNTVTIKNLKASKTYEYQMRSYSGKSAGNWGKTGKFKTTGSAYSGKLSVPSADSVTIKWKDVSNATGYEIRYKTGNGNWTTKSVSGNSYTISVSSGKTYTYQIRAVNGSNKGDWSANKTFNT